MVGESKQVLVSREELPTKTAHMCLLGTVCKGTRLGDPPRIGVCILACSHHVQVPISPPERKNDVLVHASSQPSFLYKGKDLQSIL